MSTQTPKRGPPFLPNSSRRLPPCTSASTSQSHESPSSQQFAPKPRFVLSSGTPAPRSGVSSQNRPAPTFSSQRPQTPRTPAPRYQLQDAVIEHDAIDDDGASDHSAGSDDEVLRSVEADADPDDEEMLLTIEEGLSRRASLTTPSSMPMKRRRLSNHQLYNSPTPQFQHGSTPASTLTTSPQRPRFLLRPSPAPSQLPSTSTPALAGPPRPSPFIIPSRPENAQHQEPVVPEQFSPRSTRHGQKYLPGGLAAGMREWIIGLSTGQQQGLGRDLEWSAPDSDQVGWRAEGGTLKVVVAKVTKGEGILLVEADDGGRWVLMAYGRVGRGAQDVAEGVVVGMRMPVWTIEVNTHRDGRNEADYESQTQPWRVCLSWEVLG